MSWYDDFSGSVRLNVPLAPLTWFQLGGPAKYFVEPKSLEELKAIAARLRQEEIPIYVLGGGANLLVHDEGVNGAVVSLATPAFSKVEIKGHTVSAGAGKDVQKLVLECTHAGLAGLECLAGIPGSVGGELKMNAGGAFGDIGASVETVSVMDASGTVTVREKDDLVFEYRRSNIDAKFILGATFTLTPDDPQRILSKVKEIWMFKKNSQPLADKSAGCIFRNPPGMAAGALIDQAGLKGTISGGAEISLKHGNFIIAKKGAQARDVLNLIERAKQKVAEQFDVNLETEVVIW